jgi:aspartyl aminopeptidase
LQISANHCILKQNPLYEEVELAFLKTHYYGGIRKYQWLANGFGIAGVRKKTAATILATEE